MSLLLDSGCQAISLSGFSTTRVAGNGRYVRTSFEIALTSGSNCGTTYVYVQQGGGVNTTAAIVTNRNIVSSSSDNVFWIVFDDVNDITSLSVLGDLNKVFSGQIIDQRGFPEFYGVLLDNSPSKNTFVPEMISPTGTVFAGVDKITLSCCLCRRLSRSLSLVF